ncbi:Uncharacterized protein DAT39_013283, partial [Clarias magur]
SARGCHGFMQRHTVMGNQLQSQYDVTENQFLKTLHFDEREVGQARCSGMLTHLFVSMLAVHSSED